MNKYILLLISIIFFSGCTATNMQNQNPKIQQNIKRVLVKLIRENREIKEDLQRHEQVIIDNQNIILDLKEELNNNKINLEDNEIYLDDISNKIRDIEFQLEKNTRETTYKKVTQQPIISNTKRQYHDLYIEIYANKLRLRNGPSLDYEVLAYVKNGYRFKVLDSTEDKIPWYKVAYKGKELWLFSEFTKIVSNQNIKDIDSENVNNSLMKDTKNAQ